MQARNEFASNASFSNGPQMQLPQQPMRQQHTVTRTYSPNGGWTQSVTISYGTSNQGPTIHQSHHAQGSFPQAAASASQPRNEFASAAPQQRPQSAFVHQARGPSMAQQRPQSAFFQDAFGPSMFDGFDNPLDEFLNGGMMPGFSQRRQSH